MRIFFFYRTERKNRKNIRAPPKRTPRGVGKRTAKKA